MSKENPTKEEVLAENFGVAVENVTEGYMENSYEITDNEGVYLGEFLVLTGDEAYGAVLEEIKNTVNDCGWCLNGLDIEDYIDEDMFEEEKEETYRNEIEHYDTYKFGNEAFEAGVIDRNELIDDLTQSRLDEDEDADEAAIRQELNDMTDSELFSTCVDEGVIDDYDVTEDLIEHRCNDYYGNSVEWYREEIGYLKYGENVTEDDIDWESLTDDVLANDGHGMTLARYDHNEIELENGYYAYRIN